MRSLWGPMDRTTTFGLAVAVGCVLSACAVMPRFSQPAPSSSAEMSYKSEGKGEGAACATDLECAGLLRCAEQRCTKSPPNFSKTAGDACTRNLDCIGTLKCIDQRCVGTVAGNDTGGVGDICLSDHGCIGTLKESPHNRVILD